MWLSVAADVKSSTFSVCTDADSKASRGDERSASGPDHVRLRAGVDSDLGPDSSRFGSSGGDVTTTDSDSGAVDDADLTGSGDVIAASSAHSPDGGYGWVVVVASFFNAFIIDGVGSCYGLLYPHVMEKYGSSASVASFAGSLFNALLIMGSVSVTLVRKYGYRKVTMSGGVLACLAFIISARSPNVICFVLSYGLFTGCACGLVFLPSIVIVNSYFHEKRGLANGIITSGSGAGLLVLAQLVNYLLEEFSLDGALLVLAGVLLNMCVFSSAYRPPGDPARSPPDEGSQADATSLAPESGSTDSGLLSSPSASPSLGRDLEDSDRDVKAVELEEVINDDVCEQSLAFEKDQDQRFTKRDSGINENNEFCAADGEMPQDESSQCMLNNETETALLAPQCVDVASHDEKSQDAYGKLSTAVLPSSENESYNAIFKDLQQSKAMQRPCFTGRDSRQFWMSAYNIPTQPQQFQSRVMHSSAYDVTQWGSANAKRSRTAHGLVPLAERSLHLGNPRYQRQSRSCNGHYQIKAGQHFEGERGQHSNVSYRCFFHHHDHNRDHQFQTHHRQHHKHNHHDSHLSELDKGSNLYLTGSISTLRNLQFKHILHLATSQDAGRFLSPEVPLVPKSFEAKCHLLHASKSQISESGLSIQAPIPIAGKTDSSQSSKSHLSQQSVTPFHCEDECSSFCQVSNKDTRGPHLLFSSKQSLETSSGMPYHPVQAPGMSDSSLPVSQWSLHLEGANMVSEIDLEASSQVSLSIPPAGYSLRQLMRMPCFHLFCIGSCLIQIGYPIPSIFLADLAYHQGLTTAHTTLIMGVMGGLNIAGRLLSGLLANLGVDPLTLLYTSLLLGGVACLLAPLYTTLWSLILFAGLFGFLLGAFPPVQPLVIVEYFGLNSLASVFGLLTTIKGASSMLGPPLAGLVYDTSGQYPMSFVFGGSVFLLSSAVHFAMPFFRPR